MMVQTWALLVDAYRELNAKKMFWIVLILTGVVLAGFATLGVSGNQMTVLWYAPFGKVPSALFMYKAIFSYLVVGFWFTWVAVLLALISTAGIFPDFLSAGSIDLFLAKPITRLRLFLTKYVAGLLFVLLQVTFFAVASFVILGVRAGVWQPGIFWSIPIILVFFSYLYGVCVLLGVLTRSTVAALLLTLLAWLGFWAVDRVDVVMASYINSQHATQADMEDELARIDKEIAANPGAATQPATERMGEEMYRDRVQIGSPPPGVGTRGSGSGETLEDQRAEAVSMRDEAVVSPTVEMVERVVVGVKTLIPKTRETTNLLDRELFTDKDLRAATQADAGQASQQDEFERRRAERRGQVWIDAMRERSVWWVVGTSVGFEAVVLGVAAWLFCRRDY
ncbi:MAG TPA: ABC transporter permease [Phycisphaerae bacterium]|nr:ABC transporter permease [Phycisphaerae bacterium]